MIFEFVPITEKDLTQYKADMQEAFQKGFEEDFGESEMQILPEQDIDNSLKSKGAVAYKAVVDGEMVGGAIVVIDEETQHNHLDFLYVKYGTQSKGIGKVMWDSVESLHPETKVWETCTPYFEKRNIHFYVNKCGFHIVAFWHKGNPDPHKPEGYEGDDFEVIVKKKGKALIARDCGQGLFFDSDKVERGRWHIVIDIYLDTYIRL